MSRIQYQVLSAEERIGQVCSNGLLAGVLSSDSAVSIRAISLGLLCALIVLMVAIADVGTAAGGTWEIGAFTRAEVHYQGIPENVTFIDSSNVFATSPVGVARSVSTAIQGGSTASAVSATYVNVPPDFRSGVFSSFSRAEVSVGPTPVSLGSNAFGGTGGVNWQTEVGDETLNIAYAFTGQGGDASIDVDSNGGLVNISEGTGFLTIPLGSSIEHRLLLSAGFGVVAHALTPQDSLQFAVTWGRDGLPGLSVMNPFPPQTGQQSGTFQFTIPVMQDYGIGNTLYFDPVFAHGYEYRVEGSRFASFTIPHVLPNGDKLFQLEFDGVTYDLMAGSVFDFTSIDALGASQFFLRGIDVGEMVDPDIHPPFVSGLSFTSEGIANVSQIALSVPEPSTFGIMMATMAIAAVRRRASCRSCRSKCDRS
ncbi:hypothetical protein [Bythopirellula polymerisocia]|uniref:PEP-CTERM protein-sorting domain-containing protein n=1 Tax=Bythopirellula polymerisocia TaxID=2528003 RepID=A0A5C6CNI0_9BACT|nr:hypothetical protein [Bythopirellula polymerisocia]TWU24606.1 hypothetical protein Pla144_34910 [Bythopirellula polymerisocia]